MTEMENKDFDNQKPLDTKAWKYLSSLQSDSYRNEEILREFDGKIFSWDTTMLFGESILDTHFFHLAQFTYEMKDQALKWNLKKQLLHLGDTIFYKNEGIFFQRMKKETFFDKEPECEDDPIKMTSTNHELLHKVQPYMTFAESFIFVKTNSAFYTFRRGIKNNNYSLYPVELRALDNNLSIIRTGRYSIYRTEEAPSITLDRVKNGELFEGDFLPYFDNEIGNLLFQKKGSLVFSNFNEFSYLFDQPSK